MTCYVISAISTFDWKVENSLSQEIPWILLKLKICYCVPKNQTPDIMWSILHHPLICPLLPSGLPPSGFSIIILYAFLYFPMHATCLNYPIFLKMSMLIISSKHQQSIILLCSFLQPPVTSSLLSPDILHSTLFVNTVNWHCFLGFINHVSHSRKTTNKITGSIIIISVLWHGTVQSILNHVVAINLQILSGLNLFEWNVVLGASFSNTWTMRYFQRF